MRHNDQAVGCLLLTDHPEYGNVELVYMGLTPSARGRGWGMDIARFAQWQTRQLGRARLVVAVDAANKPAIKMYSAVGFQAWDRRRVYFWRGK
jgi:RimJ/RimL family protein N-acetyltransferase